MTRLVRSKLTGIETAICTVLAIAFAAFGTVGAYIAYYY